jgi:hypothetical protein
MGAPEIKFNGSEAHWFGGGLVPALTGVADCWAFLFNSAKVLSVYKPLS